MDLLDLNVSAQHEYDSKFFDYADQSVPSAAAIVPIVLDALRCRSVLDVGCGTGAWLSVYREMGAGDIEGIDGDYVDRTRLLIPDACFHARDLARPFDLNRSFDLVQSLEVAEHIPYASSRTMVENLCRHGKHVMFSAAVPGQGGEHHINEQPLDFWRGLFKTQGFSAYDFIRPSVRGVAAVKSWYAYNTILYVSDAAEAALPESVRRWRVPDGAGIPDVAPMLFRIRTALIRPLPVSVVSWLSVRGRRWLARA